MDITQLLAFATKNKSSELHVTTGMPPLIRVHGDVRRINVEPFNHKQVQGMLYDLMNDSEKAKFEELGKLSISFEIEGQGYFSANIFNHTLGVAAIINIPQNTYFTIEDLSAPPIIKEWSKSKHGIIFSCSKTRRARIKLIEAIIDEINESILGHIVIITSFNDIKNISKKCLITSINLAREKLTYDDAIEIAKNSEAEVIVIDEINTQSVAKQVISIAENGRLVITTGNSTRVIESIKNFLNNILGSDQTATRKAFSEVFIGATSQISLQRTTNRGEISAYETLTNTQEATRQLLNEKYNNLYTIMETGRRQGMNTMDQALLALVNQKAITRSEASLHATYPDRLNISKRQSKSSRLLEAIFGFVVLPGKDKPSDYFNNRR